MFHPVAMGYTLTVSFFFCFISIFMVQLVGYLFGFCELSIPITLIAFPLSFIGFFVLHFLSFYRNKIRNQTAEFTYTQFRDWFRLNPSRIIFSDYGAGFYYLFNPEDKEYKSQWDISDYTYLQPKTFVDYVRFAYFIQKYYLVGVEVSLV